MTGIDYSKVFIDGKWVDSSSAATVDVINPYDETVVATIPAGTTDDMDRAVAAARTAFDEGPWSRLPLAERMDALRRLREILAGQQEELAQVVTKQMGCTITQARTIQIPGPLALIDTFLDLATTFEWSEVRAGGGAHSLVTREPVGVVAAVVPWNSPITVAVIKMAPALLAGATMVLKPSPEAPLDLYYLADAVREAGIPDGVVNLVTADRAESEYLISHSGVDKVAFTGSTAAGARIASICGNDLRRCSLELGGKSAAVILDDADLDTVMESVRRFSLRYNGQACNNKTRILASAKRKDEVVDRLVGLLASMPVGDPMDPDTQIGPVVSARQRDRIEGYIDGAKRDGATLVVGGGRPADQPTGWFVEPTLFADVAPDSTLAQEEVFGPVLGVITYADEEEAVAIANNSTYGLSGSVFSADAQHALDVGKRIRTGTIEVNGATAGFYAPIGGFKNSGIGREGGIEGFDEYVEAKSFGLPADLAATLTA